MIALALLAVAALQPGRYASPDARVTARVTHVGARAVRVELLGGGLPNGGATAADCLLVFQGKRASGRLTLPAIPFTSETAELTVDDLRRAPLAVALAPTRSGLSVRVRGTLPCGLGSSLDGPLRRRAPDPGPTLVMR